MESTVLAALAEPNRLRIVELLAAAPRTIGDIAGTLQLRQPQVTKHVQTLQHAGLVEVHQFGRRRVCALRRQEFGKVAGWAGALAVPTGDDATLERYGAAVAAAALAAVPAATLRRSIPAGRSAVWRAFTDPALATRWWHPRHFEVTGFRLDPRRGGRVELTLREGDGTLHRASGAVVSIAAPERLEFTLDPLGPNGRPLFTAHHDLQLSRDTDGTGATNLALTLTPSDLESGAEPAAAGLAVGWEQLLDNLHVLATDGALASGVDRL